MQLDGRRGLEVRDLAVVVLDDANVGELHGVIVVGCLHDDGGNILGLLSGGSVELLANLGCEVSGSLRGGGEDLK